MNGRGRVGRDYGSRNNPTIGDQANKRVTLYAIVENPSAQNQYAVIQTQDTHGGETFKLLIDCRSTHSFLSPRCLRKLKLDQFNDSGDGKWQGSFVKDRNKVP